VALQVQHKFLRAMESLTRTCGSFCFQVRHMFLRGDAVADAHNEVYRRVLSEDVGILACGPRWWRRLSASAGSDSEQDLQGRRVSDVEANPRV
jgi:hypothetical protein